MSGPKRRIVIQKQARALLLYEEDRLARSYAVVLGRNWAADKAVEGDEATPLGEFYVCAKNPRSKYFLSMCLSYPNAEDAERGLAGDLITPAVHAEILAAIRAQSVPPQRTRLGGEIYIHGEDPARPGASATDGTRGCVALDNAAMQELYDCTPLGTPVLITL
jgi:L,D-peptidoglycan transpeptidase YkuD (ErfK/YbiS/YcfS/YnhG family)